MPPMAPRPAAAVGRGPRPVLLLVEAAPAPPVSVPEPVGAGVVLEPVGEPVLEPEPEPVVWAPADVVSAAAEVLVCAAVVLHETTEGRSVTPMPLQSCLRSKSCQQMFKECANDRGSSP